MTPIQLTIFTAAGTTRRESFSSSPVTFGREADNLAVVDQPTASRHHGELRWLDDHWVLVNLSPNGTRVDGREIGRKPVRLAGGETVGVGDAALFKVHLAPVVVAVADVDAVHDGTNGTAGAAGGAPKSRRRTTVWALIAAYVLVMLGLMVFFSTLGGNKAAELAKLTAPLTAQEIEREITRLLPAMALNPERGHTCLVAANEFYDKMDTWKGNIYLAYHNYRLALAYDGRDDFDPGENQLRLQRVQRQLVDVVTSQYLDAYEQLRSGDYVGAEAGFHRLNRDLYPVSESLIYRNSEQQRSTAVQRMKDRRSFF